MKNMMSSDARASQQTTKCRFQTFLSLIATAIMVLSLSACGGSGASSSGVFGKLPSIYADNMGKAEEIAKNLKAASDAGDKQKFEKLLAEMLTFTTETKHEIENTGKELVGKAVEVEIVGDYGLQLNGEASITEVENDGSVIIDIPVVTTSDVAFSEGKATKTIPTRMALVGQNGDGENIVADIAAKSFGDYQETYPEGHQAKYTASIKITEYNYEALSKCKKFVFVASDSEEYEAAEAFDKAAKDAYKNEHADMSIL